MTELAGTRIVVTGGASGVGAACVAGFAGAGATVVSLDVDEVGGIHVVDKARASGGQCSFIGCDLADRESVDAAMDEAAARMGGIRVLAHLAAVVELSPLAGLTEARLKRLIDVNVMGTMFVNQAARRSMLPGGGRIINAGSPAGARPLPGFGAYGLTKAAIMSWSRTAAAEWGPEGITVNVVIPLAVTAMALDTLPAEIPLEERRRILSGPFDQVPLGRIWPVETGVLPLMEFLASERAGYINGQCINADGGMTMFGS